MLEKSEATIESNMMRVRNSKSNHLPKVLLGYVDVILILAGPGKGIVPDDASTMNMYIHYRCLPNSVNTENSFLGISRHTCPKKTFFHVLWVGMPNTSDMQCDSVPRPISRILHFISYLYELYTTIPSFHLHLHLRYQACSDRTLWVVCYPSNHSLLCCNHHLGFCSIFLLYCHHILA